MSSGCDCSGNYFNSLSNSMSSLPQSDYGLMSGSSLGMNSQEFITGTNTRQNQNPYADNSNMNHYGDNSNSNMYGNHANNGNNYINNSNPLNNGNNMMNPNMGSPRPQQEQAQPMMRNNHNHNTQPVVQVKQPQPVVEPAPVKNVVVEQPKCNNLLSKNNFLLIVLLLAGLAWHEVIRFYINKSIKCGEGTHQYYVYYAIAASAIGFFILSR